MRFRNTVMIRRSPREVFEFLADFENVPRWNDAIVETHKTSKGPVQVGTTYRQVRSLPTKSEETFEVVVFEPGLRLAIRGGLGPFEGELTYELEPAEGGTRVINEADLQARGAVKLLAPIAAGRIRDAVATNLRKLKRLLETD